MTKLIIDCKTYGEAINLLSNLLYTIVEARYKAFKDYNEAMERREFDIADFYSAEYKKAVALSKQIRTRARVEF